MKTAAEYASLNSNPQLDWTSSFEDRRDFIQSIIDASVAHGMTIAAGVAILLPAHKNCGEVRDAIITARDNKAWKVIETTLS